MLTALVPALRIRGQAEEIRLKISYTLAPFRRVFAPAILFAMALGLANDNTICRADGAP
jgi:hypothetical protein